MENPEFEWDDDKAVSNLKKHGISFDEGATIFNDPGIASISDPRPFQGRRKIYLHWEICAGPLTGCCPHGTRGKVPPNQL